MASEALFLTSQSSLPPLRIGLLFPTHDLPPPAALLLEYLGRCNYIDVVAAIGVRAPRPTRTKPFIYRLYRWLDQLTAPAIAAELAAQNCSTALRRFSAYSVDSDATGERLLPSDAQRSTLASCRLDLILMLSASPEPLALAGLVRYGIWRMHLGDPLLGDDEARHFWSTIRQSAPLSVWLQARLAGHAAPVTLASGTLTPSSSLSTARNLMGSAQLGAALLLSTLWQLHGCGWDFVLARQRESEPARAESGLPSNRQMFVWSLIRLVRHIQHRIRQHNTAAIWRVAIRCGSRLEGLAAAQESAGLSWLEAPAGSYYADPFVISRDHAAFVLVEEFSLSSTKGRIVCIGVNPNGSCAPPQVALERPYHVSYPQLLTHDGELYMIPESGGRETVELYRALEFPTRWELIRVLFNAPAFDTTLLHHAGLFWFFVSLIDSHYPQYTLLVLFYSDSLLGEWKLHPASPISADIRTARCGGPLFLDRGHWIRPAQDGSQSYGGALHYQRIVELDTRQYREQPAGSFDTRSIPGASGVHTYSRAGWVEALDAKSRVVVPDPLSRSRTTAR
jgi:hypothetical protein